MPTLQATTNPGDSPSFVVLQAQVIPKLFANKATGEASRVWTAGCSTDEEDRSIALLLVERMDACKASHEAQLFATDIDPRAIATARLRVSRSPPPQIGGCMACANRRT
jgi:two-component system CheB/CheR fusion protein